MRFTPHPRLLETLVGSNLYASPDVIVRELVQNGRDAIVLRAALDPALQPRIDVRINKSARWFEVQDNGLGMNEVEIKKGLLQIGSDKRDVIQDVDVKDEDQIAMFGIGFLSVFLIASKVVVTTRRHGEQQGLQLEAADLEHAIELSTVSVEQVGTTVRVHVREGAEFDDEFVKAGLRHIRHLSDIHLTDIDSATTEQLTEKWAIENLFDVTNVLEAEGVRSGKIGFQDALKDVNRPLSNSFTLCNGGFLVEEHVLDLVAAPPFGFSGELDLVPTALNVVMARERFQRDSDWQELGQEMSNRLLGATLTALRTGFVFSENLSAEESMRVVLLWRSLVPNDDRWRELRNELDQRVFNDLRFELSERRPATLGTIVKDLPSDRVYFRMIGATQLRGHIDDEGLPIRFTEEVRDSVRVGALRARGYEVLELRRLQYTEQQAGGAVQHEVQVSEILKRILLDKGYELTSITDARDEDMDLRSVERLPIVTPFLSPDGSIRFAEILDSPRRVVRDSAGLRYLNIRNDTIRRLLAVIPQSVGNPLRARLLEIYVSLESFDLVGARESTMALLETDELATLASVDSAPLSREAIEQAVNRIVSAGEET